MSQALPKLEDILQDVEEEQVLPSEEIFSSVFHDATIKNHTDDYPDIFKHLFLELIEKSEENQYSLKLLLIVACKATLQ